MHVLWEKETQRVEVLPSMETCVWPEFAVRVAGGCEGVHS